MQKPSTPLRRNSKNNFVPPLLQLESQCVKLHWAYCKIKAGVISLYMSLEQTMRTHFWAIPIRLKTWKWWTRFISPTPPKHLCPILPHSPLRPPEQQGEPCIDHWPSLFLCSPVFAPHSLHRINTWSSVWITPNASVQNVTRTFLPTSARSQINTRNTRTNPPLSSSSVQPSLDQWNFKN